MTKIDTSSLDTVSTQTSSKRRHIFDILLITSIIGFALSTVIAYAYDYLRIDLIITDFLQSLHSQLLDTWLVFISELGNYPYVIILLGLTIITLLFLKRFKDALFILISTIGITLISEILKDLIARPRPTDLLISTVPFDLPPGSFPSGHVLFYCGFFGSILFLTYVRLKKSLLRTFLIIGLLILIFSVGISRIYLGAHWFSDVVGSYFLGFIWLYLMSFVYRYLRL